jgi:hypothetical protein
MINWIYYPKSLAAPPVVLQVVEAFQNVSEEIDSDSFDLNSNSVLSKVSASLQLIGFSVEQGKNADQKVRVPVLFGMNGRLEKSFDADAYNKSEGFVIEVEAGRGVLNNQFLKDLFQACMMHDVRILGIAVRNIYKKRKDFFEVSRFFDTLYASNRLRLPLEGILILGY